MFVHRKHSSRWVCCRIWRDCEYLISGMKSRSQSVSSSLHAAEFLIQRLASPRTCPRTLYKTFHSVLTVRFPFPKTIIPASSSLSCHQPNFLAKYSYECFMYHHNSHLLDDRGISLGLKTRNGNRACRSLHSQRGARDNCILDSTHQRHEPGGHDVGFLRNLWCGR